MRSELDDELELARLHDRQFRRLRALEDAAGINADLAIRVGDARAIAHQPTGLDKFTHRVSRGKRMARGQRGQLDAPVGEERVGADKEGVGPLSHKRCVGGIDLLTGTGIVKLSLQPEDASSRFKVAARGLRPRQRWPD